ncbi:MAG TPA: hypothetical protein DCE42_08250, partial [Myxococcales bacterium]|nr:hypothetical protein [Myxococcales bacterium]
MSSFDRDFGGHNFEPVEKTVLLDDMAAQLLERRPPGDPELANEYRILVVDPAGQEWEYPIRGEVLLGRSEENQIMIEDRAVSRHHLAINTDGKLFWFQDLNSGNGTQLNGEYVQEGWLTGGEEIIIGNSRIYFLIPGSATDNAEPQADDLPMDPGSLVAAPIQDAASLVATPSPASPAAAPEAEEDDEGGKWLALALVVFVLGLGVAGLGAWFLYKRLGAGKKPTVIGQTSARSSLKKLQHGNKLIQEGKFAEASRFFRMAASSVPESNSYRSTFLERANIAGIEAIAKKYYNEAKKLYYEEDKACDAYGSLKKVSKRSSLFKKADKLRKRIFNKDIKRSLRMIDLMIASNNPVERKKARKKLQELQYCDTDLPGIKQRLTKLNQPHTPNTPSVPDPRSARRPPPPPRRRRYRRPSYRRPKVRRSSGTISQGVSLFCKGQYAASIVHFSRIIGSSSGSKRRKARRYRSAV